MGLDKNTVELYGAAIQGYLIFGTLKIEAIQGSRLYTPYSHISNYAMPPSTVSWQRNKRNALLYRDDDYIKPRRGGGGGGGDPLGQLIYEPMQTGQENKHCPFIPTAIEQYPVPELLAMGILRKFSYFSVLLFTLVVYYNKKKTCYECRLIANYRGKFSDDYRN